MNQFAGKLELEAGITVLQNECERISSSVPIHFGKGVSLTHGASIYCTGVGDDIYIGDNNIIGGELIVSGSKNRQSLCFWYRNYNCRG